MIELLEKYPKTAKVVREHFLEKMLEGLKNKDLPDEFKEHVRQQGITNEKIAKLIDNQARALFDVFDENSVFIEINVTYTPKKENMFFSFAVNDIVHQNGPQAATYKTRKEAEKAAVEKAFKLLEEKL